ncbi:histone H2B.3-like [Cucumis melo var. makuwa]|uniref:Histone H2B.3-like n=1 Tax=Cucumis melo var. makuwa TaxID=1194695 RepID=A0A5A7VIX9_CUCMM|nr:histone H2B.3-like [Cucumis melo var. makuwa]TYK09012.1 histone H2B.3-like [Cucumis melo var. makuwa]
MESGIWLGRASALLALLVGLWAWPDGSTDDILQSYCQLANLALIPLVTIVTFKHNCAVNNTLDKYALDTQQTQAAPSQTPVVPQVIPDQLSTESKHLRDFRKYNPKTFDGSMDNPTKAQMWLTSIETIFRYMKCPDDQKVQCAVFFLEDRGTA